MRTETRVEQISSGQNPKIKDLIALSEKSKLRKQKGLFVVEGVRELSHCVAMGYCVDSVFFCPTILGDDVFTALDVTGAGKDSFSDTKWFEITAEIYSKVAYREGTEGVIAEVRSKEHRLEDLKLSPTPLVIILESVEKPGNLGAVLRSADAAGADAVIVCDPLTDLYNPNLIRSSIGAVFTVPCCTCTSQECISWLKKNGIQILTAQLQDSQWYYDTDMTLATAIVIGTESVGLTQQWRLAADRHVKIPMLGHLDSLNASVSAAILLFEAVRQRNS